jgi:glycosyltransferase involved in cell wall biosynthesis
MITIQNKIWESMAVGRPVISGDGPAVRRILNHREDIYLVDRLDPSSIAAGIDELKSDSSLREQIAMAGYRRAREHSISSIGSIIVEAISTLTSS